MSRGLGRVQNRCLNALVIYEGKDGKGTPLTTYDIAAYVYGHDKITDAQHVAVKRALESLQRRSMVIGFARRYCRHDDFYDGRSNLYCWMTERRARQWIREQGSNHAELVAIFKAKMLTIGMKP